MVARQQQSKCYRFWCRLPASQRKSNKFLFWPPFQLLMQLPNNCNLDKLLWFKCWRIHHFWLALRFLKSCLHQRWLAGSLTIHQRSRQHYTKCVELRPDIRKLWLLRSQLRFVICTGSGQCNNVCNASRYGSSRRSEFCEPIHLQWPHTQLVLRWIRQLLNSLPWQHQQHRVANQQ